MVVVDSLNSFLAMLDLQTFTDLVQCFLIYGMNDDLLESCCSKIEEILIDYNKHRGVSLNYVNDTYREIADLYKKDNQSPFALVEMESRLRWVRIFLDLNLSLETIEDTYIKVVTDLSTCLSVASCKKALESLTLFKDRVAVQYVNKQELKKHAYDLALIVREIMVTKKIEGWDCLRAPRQRVPSMSVVQQSADLRGLFVNSDFKDEVKGTMSSDVDKTNIETSIQRFSEVLGIPKQLINKVTKEDPKEETKEETKEEPTPESKPKVDLPSGISLGNGNESKKEVMEPVKKEADSKEPAINKVIPSSDGGQTFRMKKPDPDKPFTGGLNVHFPGKGANGGNNGRD